MSSTLGCLDFPSNSPNVSPLVPPLSEKNKTLDQNTEEIRMLQNPSLSFLAQVICERFPIVINFIKL